QPSTPLLHAPIAVPDRILEFLEHGRLDTDIPLATWHSPTLVDTVPLPAPVEAALRSNLANARARLCVEGVPGSGRLTSVRLVSAALGQGVVEVALTEDTLDSVQIANMLREARLRGAVLVVRADDIDALDNNPLIREALSSDYPGRVVV